MDDVLVLGGGVAGLSAAVRAARAGCSVVLVTKTVMGTSATQYAQGGVAAVVETAADSIELHLSDTLSAGAGLCDLEAVRILVTEGPERIRELIEMGAEFDRDAQRHFAFTREGGHSVARILHAGGDATGAEVERALVAGVRSTGADVRERWFVRDLVVDGGRAVGVRALDPDGVDNEIRARHTIIATGGAGQCYAVTTNPALSTGDGIAVALRSGVAVADLEFMQFHPTALHVPTMPRPLLSEAMRGEGAVLRDETGHAFMADDHPLGDLAPRDVVARAITRRCLERGLEHLWLDATTIPDFEHRFPTVWRAVAAAGFDPTHDLLPVAPAAHYLSGGVCTDLDGATTVPGLWACGETSCSGVHGANRLASNSLLDGLVFGARTIDAIVQGKDAPDPTGVLRGILDDTAPGSEAAGPMDATATATPGSLRSSTRDELQRVMTRDAGVVREAESLRRAIESLAEMRFESVEDENLRQVSMALVRAAIAREESRGTHTRLDFPDTSAGLLGRFVFRGGEVEPSFVPLPQRAAAR